MAYEVIKFLIGFLSSVLLFFGVVGLSYDWFTVDSINAFGAVLMAAVPLAGAVYGVWKNNYISKKGQEQKAELEKKNLL